MQGGLFLCGQPFEIGPSVAQYDFLFELPVYLPDQSAGDVRGQVLGCGSVTSAEALVKGAACCRANPTVKEVSKHR